jgi:hypothetical protein
MLQEIIPLELGVVEHLLPQTESLAGCIALKAINGVALWVPIVARFAVLP